MHGSANEGIFVTIPADRNRPGGGLSRHSSSTLSDPVVSDLGAGPEPRQFRLTDSLSYYVTLRAIALRMLRRVDDTVATEFVNTPAFDEYVHAVEHWIKTDATRNSDTLRECQAEHDWLAVTRKR